MIGQAQTGTGKTAAFALPLMEQIDIKLTKPQVLVLTPTRELAIQVAEALQSYAKNLPGFHVLPIYGGQSYTIQLKQLSRGAHVIVGTPGRVMDHLERKTLNLDNLKTMVLDEADEMLRMGFIDDVEWILERTPAQHQTALFSATMPDRSAASPRNTWSSRGNQDQVGHRHRRRHPSGLLAGQRHAQAGRADPHPRSRRQLRRRHHLRAHQERHRRTGRQALRPRLRRRRAERRPQPADARTRHRAVEVRRPRHRRRHRRRRPRHRRAARQPRVNYDIPYDTEAYVHRIGRTGRAGRTGNAILFVAPREVSMLRSIERATRQPIMPTEILQLLKKSWVAGQRLRMSKFTEGSPSARSKDAADERPRSPRPGSKPPHKGKPGGHFKHKTHRE
jgi:ATP-dependent RNA helicase DeaD